MTGMSHALSLALALATAGAAAAAPPADGGRNTRPIVLGDDAPACAPDADVPALKLKVAGLKHRGGYLRAELYPANDADFLKPDRLLEAEGKPFRRVWVPVPATGPAEVCLKAPGPGTWAVSVLHFAERRWKFDFRRDGAGFTNNPKLGLARPKAAAVAIPVAVGGRETTVVMNYLHGLGFRPIARKAERLAGAAD